MADSTLSANFVDAQNEVILTSGVEEKGLCNLVVLSGNAVGNGQNVLILGSSVATFGRKKEEAAAAASLLLNDNPLLSLLRPTPF